MFRRDMSPPPKGLKKETKQKLAWIIHQARLCFMLVSWEVYSTLKMETTSSIETVGWLPTDWTESGFYSRHDAQTRTQWSRSRRHEPSSSTQALGSWVRIPLKAGISVCVCAVLCVQPCDVLIPRPRSTTDCVKNQGTETRPRSNKRAVEPCR
jgi:hypothetical protein